MKNFNQITNNVCDHNEQREGIFNKGALYPQEND